MKICIVLLSLLVLLPCLRAREISRDDIDKIIGLLYDSDDADENDCSDESDDDSDLTQKTDSLKNRVENNADSDFIQKSATELAPGYGGDFEASRRPDLQTLLDDIAAYNARNDNDFNDEKALTFKTFDREYATDDDANVLRRLENDQGNWRY